MEAASATDGTSPRLARIRVRTLNSDVYASLRQALIRGHFAAGEVLRIQSVADMLGTSTMPVREAFARLTSERALEAMPNRSTRVPLITFSRLENLAHARALVEGDMLRQAAPRLGAKDIADLRALTQAYDDATLNDAPSAADLNHAFHSRLYASAGSEVLMAVVESLWLQSGPYVRAAVEVHDAGRSQPATHHHHAILDALEAGDAMSAHDALMADIGFAFALLRDRLRDEEIAA